MTKKQYLRKQLISCIILCNSVTLIALIAIFLFIKYCRLIDTSAFKAIHGIAFLLVKIVAFILFIMTLFARLLFNLTKAKLEEEFDKMESKKYVEEIFSKSTKYEVELTSPSMHPDVFSDLRKMGILHFFASIDPADDQNVLIIVEIKHQGKQTFEKIRKEKFLDNYKVI